MRNYVITLATLILTVTLVSKTAFSAQGSGASTGSAAASAVGSAMIVQGSVEILGAGMQFTVASVEIIGDIASITLEASAEVASAVLDAAVYGAAESLEITIEVSASMLNSAISASQTAALAMGDIVETVAVGSGYMLVASGYVIAFIPTTVGATLIYHGTH